MKCSFVGIIDDTTRCPHEGEVVVLKHGSTQHMVATACDDHKDKFENLLIKLEATDSSAFHP